MWVNNPSEGIDVLHCLGRVTTNKSSVLQRGCICWKRDFRGVCLHCTLEYKLMLEIIYWTNIFFQVKFWSVNCTSGEDMEGPQHTHRFVEELVTQITEELPSTLLCFESSVSWVTGYRQVQLPSTLLSATITSRVCSGWQARQVTGLSPDMHSSATSDTKRC